MALFVRKGGSRHAGQVALPQRNIQTYFDLPSRLERDFAEIDSKIVMNLYDTNNEYAQLQQQISDLTKKYPFIENVIEGEGEIHISNDEHEVLVQYFKLNRKLSDM